MKNHEGTIVSINRNPLYDNKELRELANRDVLEFVNTYAKYDFKEDVQFVFPWLKDKPKEFYCSELANHFSLEHSCGKVNLRTNGKLDDDVSPYEIQRSKACSTIEQLRDIRSMDYIGVHGYGLFHLITGIVTAKSLSHKIATHTAIVVKVHGYYMLAEMLAGGVHICSINKYL